MSLSNFAIKHPAIVGILLISLVGGAIIAVAGLHQQLFAAVELPQAVIITTYPGGSPEDVEQDVTNPLEDELSLLNGVTEISSTSSDSVSRITLNFTLDTEISDRIIDIRESINTALPLLPDGISGEPQIYRMAAGSISALTVVARSDLPSAELSKFLEDQVVPRISRISGVARANLNGNTEEELHIVLDLDKLRARNISPLEVTGIIQRNNISMPAGEVVLRDRTMNIRSSGRFSSAEEAALLLLGVQDGAQILLRDVVESIGYANSERGIIPISQGEEIITLSLDLLENADTPTTLSDARDTFREITQEQEGAVTFEILADDSETIEFSLMSVVNSAAMGGILAVVILFMFLHNFRSTSIVAVSIPLSLLVALCAMRLAGMTLNIMTLTGLTIAIGMIVDASIVMLEHIYYHFNQGLDAKEAALAGAKEMGGAILASTMTTLAVFLPLLFLSGMIGIILRDISLTLAFSLIGSLIVALAIIPFLAAGSLKRKPVTDGVEVPAKLDRFFKFMETFLEWLGKKYRSLLSKALDNKAYVIFTAIVLLVVSALITRFVGFQFIPQVDMNELILTAEFPQGYSLESTGERSLELEDEVYKLVPEIDTAVFFTGQSGLFSSGQGEPNKMFSIIRLSRTGSRDRGVQEIINNLQEELPRKIPDLNLTVSNGGLNKLMDITTGGSGFIIEVSGSNMDDLIRSADLVAHAMSLDPNIQKVDSNVNTDRRSLEIILDPRLMGSVGVNAQSAGATNRIVFSGVEVGTLDSERGSTPIIVKTAYSEGVIGSDILNRIWLRNAAGELIPSRAFSSLSDEPAISSIPHKNGLTTIKVSGQLSTSNIRDTRELVTSFLNQAEFPPGVEWTVGGSAAELTDAMSSLMVVVLISIFLVYAVMVIQFERFIQPLIVMASVPFTLIGVMISLVIFGSTLDIVSMLGIIALSGIVVNNAIVLIDYTNLLVSRGENLREAVIDAASSRLKPILMTTLTTMLGIFPIALGLGEGGTMLAGLGQAIAGGLLTSTLITLILIPVLYVMVESRKTGVTNSE